MVPSFKSRIAWYQRFRWKYGRLCRKVTFSKPMASEAQAATTNIIPKQGERAQ